MTHWEVHLVISFELQFLTVTDLHRFAVEDLAIISFALASDSIPALLAAPNRFAIGVLLVPSDKSPSIARAMCASW